MKQKIRCAIYTRKSSEEGLDQEFNSLDAQYEACASYINSQKHEGWRRVKSRYDDGGISGGTMERPAFKRLLLGIDAGLIDMIVLYKIDRLTRSLADFTKIVEKLDAKGASFVSVTQSFNTATSMGRLTLNMLLSFAQFEREVTGERIRDKIAASKAKGMWMGGLIPLGYNKNPDKNIRGLVINFQEAKTIKTLFDLYEELGCLSKVATHAKAQGLRGKSRQGKQGAILTHGAIYKHLTNVLYAGKIKHKDKIYDGKHKAIIDAGQWERVQGKLQDASQKRRGQHIDTPHDAPLIGKLFDETGDHLTPSHSKKKRKVTSNPKNDTPQFETIIHRYYISNRLIRSKDPGGWRLPAKLIEDALITIIKDQLPKELSHIIPQPETITEVQNQKRSIQNIRNLDKSACFLSISRVDLAPDKISITLNPEELAKEMSEIDRIEPITITAPMNLKKRGVEQKLIIDGQKRAPDQKLIQNIATAHLWLKDLKSGKTIKDIAIQNNKSTAHIRTRIQLATLSPKIQKAILTGQQPSHLTTEHIIKSNMPTNWQDQEQQYGLK